MNSIKKKNKKKKLFTFFDIFIWAILTAFVAIRLQFPKFFFEADIVGIGIFALQILFQITSSSYGWKPHRYIGYLKFIVFLVVSIGAVVISKG